jgi:hypothetical protein
VQTNKKGEEEEEEKKKVMAVYGRMSNLFITLVLLSEDAHAVGCRHMVCSVGNFVLLCVCLLLYTVK